MPAIPPKGLLNCPACPAAPSAFPEPPSVFPAPAAFPNPMGNPPKPPMLAKGFVVDEGGGVAVDDDVAVVDAPPDQGLGRGAVLGLVGVGPLGMLVVDEGLFWA